MTPEETTNKQVANDEAVVAEDASTEATTGTETAEGETAE